MKSKAILSVIIVSWNTKDILFNCLDSLLKQPTSVIFDTYVVDNNSTDGSPELVRKFFPGVVLIENKQNVGFARANNQVLRMVKTPYALLLNSDTVLPYEDILSPWIEFMENNPDVAASGCRLVFPDGSEQVGDAGFKPLLKHIINHSFFLSRLCPNYCKGLFITSIPNPNGIIDVDWICGADLMVRVSAIRTVGLLDESMFMFAEDIEWCCRMKDNGFRVCYIPYLKIIHLQGASTSVEHSDKRLSSLWVRNIRKVFQHYNPNVPVRMYDFFMGVGFLLRWFVYRLKGSRQKAKRMLYYLKGLTIYD